MGQIVSAAAKPKRCNLNQLSQVPTPAAGEHILVSSDNSMNAAGQGNFDCYIVGDGQKAATALPLIKTYANDVDDEPTAGSDKLVKSSGVEKQTNRLFSFTLGWSALPIYDGLLAYSGWGLGQGTHRQIKVQKGDEISVKGNATNGSYLGVLKIGGQPISSRVNYATGCSRIAVPVNSVNDFTVTADDAQYLAVEIERTVGSTTPQYLYINGVNILENTIENTIEETQLLNDDVYGCLRTTYQAALYYGKFSYGTGTYCLIPVKQGDVVTVRCDNNPSYYVVLKDKQIVTSGQPAYHFATGENDRHINGGNLPVHSTYTITASDAAYIALEVSRVESNVTISSLPKIMTINGKSVLGLEHDTQNANSLVEYPTTRYASIASTPNAYINITGTEIVIPAALRIVYGEGKVYRLPSAVTLQRMAGTGSAAQSEYVYFDASDNSIHTIGEADITVNTFTSEIYILFIVLNGLSGCSLSFSQYTINGSSPSYLENNTDIIYQNKHKESTLIATLLNKGNNAIKSDNKVSLLFFTDLHGNAANLARIVEFGTQYATYLDDMIHGGDSVNLTIQDANPFESVAGAQNILNVAGNHEAWLQTSDTDYLATEKQVYDKIFANSIANWNVVQPTDAATNGYCYYYKDYRNMRLIVLDDVHWHKGGNQQIVDDYTTQKTWFEGVLADAITNSKVVICAMHYTPRYIVPLTNVKGFNRYGTTESTDISDGWYADDLIFDCVDTFINNGGKFMGWMMGHTHNDYIGYVKNHANQPVVITGTAGAGSTDNKNVVGTNSQDNFNIITFSWIDNSKKLIKILRVGNDMDMYGRSKKNISFNTVDGSILEVE